jgi:Mrp family chromosome partitioning ATPase
MNNKPNDIEPRTIPAESPQVVNLVLQGKGGVGKSLVASILAQFYRANGHAVKCIDTDPVNQTFSQYAGIGAQHMKSSPCALGLGALALAQSFTHGSQQIT